MIAPPKKSPRSGKDAGGLKALTDQLAENSVKVSGCQIQDADVLQFLRRKLREAYKQWRASGCCNADALNEARSRKLELTTYLRWRAKHRIAAPSGRRTS